jgi:hypothetical protein
MMSQPDEVEELALNKSAGKEYRIPCTRCLNQTKHKVLLSADVDGQVLGFLYWEQHQIIQCEGCGAISFRKNTTNTEDFTMVQLPNGEYDEILDDHEEIFPSRIPGRTHVKRSWLLPSTVKGIYDETHSALSNKLRVLAAVGIRILIESVCKEKGASGSNLKEEIDSLLAKGILTKEGADILHALRGQGNESAHEMKAQDEDAIDLAMDVVDNLLQSVYILPEASRRQSTRLS